MFKTSAVITTQNKEKLGSQRSGFIEKLGLNREERPALCTQNI